MSKEKIIGLSVIGVLTATLAGVTAWRMLGGKATSGEPAAIVADETAQAANAGEKSTGPTVLASATSSGTDSIADRLSGKTKIKGGWETAASASSAPVDPTLPAGAHGGAKSGRAAYNGQGSAGDLTATARDQERQPSYMPRETVDETAPGEARYTADMVAEESAAEGELADNTAAAIYGNEPSLEVPHELAPDPNALANAPRATSALGDAAGSYGTPEQEAIQIVEHQPIPAVELTQPVETDPEAERAALRAADDARFAEAYAKEQEAVQIASSALEPQPTSSFAANEVPNLSQSTEAAPPARFTADARFAADERYAPAVESEQPVQVLPKNVTPTEATVPAVGETVPPRAGYGATPAASETYPAQPSYRDSVYREPAAVSAAGSAPIARSTPAPAASATTPPAADPYAAPAQVPAAAPYGGSARAASVSTGAMPNAAAEKHVPQRENTGKYYVEPGDSFWIIAKKVYGNGGFFKALQEHNRARFITPSNLQVGDEVLTPSVAELRDLYSGLCPKERIAKPGSPAAMQASHLPVSQAGSVRPYEVQAGDTLFDIARYELGDAKRWPEIYQLNRVALGADIDYVKPGTKLMLPMDATLEAAPEGDGYRGDILTRKPGSLR